MLENYLLFILVIEKMKYGGIFDQQDMCGLLIYMCKLSTRFDLIDIFV